MNTTALSIFRVAVCFGLSMVACLGILSEPLEDSNTWFADFFIAKFLGGLALLLCIALYKEWRKTDKWFAAYDKFCDKADEVENPMCIYNEEED